VGHGSYVAPDWSADWLHREALALRDILASKRYGARYDALPAAERAGVDAALRVDLRRNGYDAASGTITVSNERAQAIVAVAAHYKALFGDDPALGSLRDQYAMTTGALPQASQREALSAFFFWSAWSAVSDRPGESGLSYTSNWPHDPLVGNELTAGSALWSIASIILLIAGIAGMLWYHGAHAEAPDPTTPARDPLLAAVATPSMKATRKYFFVVIGLLLTQIGMGAITAHYAVEGHGFFGFPLAEVLPYVVSRTIHTQFGVFWIATAWLATGLYIAPLLSGREPRHQKLGVDVLFWALIAIVVGSTAFGWLGTLQKQGYDFSFWIGNQGLEFTSMGRVWQLLLFVGLLFWLFLLGRALWPALKQAVGDARPRRDGVPVGRRASAASTRLADLGQHTHYSMVEYWRWWLVHLWVEGFFEVFATAVDRADLHAPRARGAVERQPRHRARDDRVPVRRHPRHAAPSLLDRHADLRHRRRRGVLGAGGRAAALIGVEGCATTALAVQHPGSPPIAGRSSALSRWASGTPWARDCSASRSTRRRRCTTSRGST
jgi:nitric oxide reductase subunit B